MIGQARRASANDGDVRGGQNRKRKGGRCGGGIIAGEADEGDETDKRDERVGHGGRSGQGHAGNTGMPARVGERGDAGGRWTTQHDTNNAGRSEQGRATPEAAGGRRAARRTPGDVARRPTPREEDKGGENDGAQSAKTDNKKPIRGRATGAGADDNVKKQM